MALAEWATLQCEGATRLLLWAISAWPDDGPYSLCIGLLGP